MDYAVTYLSLIPGAVPAVLPKIQAELPAMALGGEFLGCFYSEIGELNQVALLYGHTTADGFTGDQKRMDDHRNAFGISDVTLSRRSDLFRLFPGVAPIKREECGPFFEFRTYRLRADSLPATFAAWGKVLTERTKISPLVTVMHALTGEMPRFMHIWPYRDLVARMKLRGDAVTAGVWPPPGGIQHLITMRSEIFLAAPFSPIR